MMWMVTISDSWCESLRLHLVFNNFNILFDKNILLDYNIIKHYLSIVILLKTFLHCLYCVYSLYLILSLIENDQNSLLLDKNILFE